MSVLLGVPAVRGSGVVAVFAAASVAGLLFGPVFGVGALLLPVGATVLPSLAVTLWLRSREAWRAVAAVVAGLAGLLVALRANPSAVLAGVTDSWRLALQTTWPALPEPEVVVFVPLLVLAASVFGVELLLRLRAPLVSLLPSLGVVALSQAYAAASGAPAILAAVVFAACGAVIVARGIPWAAVALGVVGAVALGAVSSGPALSLRTDEFAPLATPRVASPLDELPSRLADPSKPVFEYTSSARVDRWPIAVLDEFDGVNWTPGGELRRMGAGLPPVVESPSSRSAEVRLLESLGRPWLPSQTWPATVEGVDALVDPARGTLLSEADVSSYTLTWWEPQVDPTSLMGKAIDPSAPGGKAGVGTAPASVHALANAAVQEMRSSFRTAMVLEKYMRDNYELVTTGDLPVGHGWPQLERFLTVEKRGTREQFAAAYVAMARLLGIPARLVVGFAGPDSGSVVRNGDALAWPEVAVAGVGWVALDPTGSARVSSASNGLSAVTEEARSQLPPVEDMVSPDLPAAPEDVAPTTRVPWALALWLLVVPAVGWLPAVPVLVGVRSWRRRRSGTVADAWAEVRDRLRRHGVAVTPAMTVRDAATAARPVVDPPTADALSGLATAVDATMWSGAPVDARAQAWAAVRAVRAGLARRPWKARLRAAFRY
ncbi:transglutaminase TgpA family protein [Saccharothrix deserti]|uniref:transglutaminase TgpA family protein n=1 Tax=Saccharothrix deserti TaxID=2593674 RepID=UPI00131AE44C|nr:transglutaminaseTgpA domain-containing protein [Saccharothrix deserti]